MTLPFFLIVLGIILIAKPFKTKEQETLWFQRIVGVILLCIGAYLPFTSPKETVKWEPYSETRIEEVLGAGKPIIIDFFAEWCAPCHELDYYTYSNADVIAALEPFVRIKADMTNPKNPEVLKVVDRFQVTGVPTILFIDAQGEIIEESRIMGFVGPEELLMVIRSPKLQSRGA